ncbi:ABC transporter substrate-binding protein [Corynebacterium pacaense]|uniref:ABC transporter substrate-binding protein n=1 Tax=Corynebacterium pacaense TaxID=1816684 RepID=UPI0009BC3B01|nr:ABC transporter substrate-binding protein [Corynebacterium pacaense]
MSASSRTLPAFLVSLLLTAVALVGCSSDGADTTADSTTPAASAEGFPVTVEFAGSEPVTLDNQPERIVSLSPTATEMLFAVGAGDQVVAVDEYSDYPADAPTVAGLSGYSPSVEAVLDYDPDLVVLMDKSESIVDGLKSAGVPVLMIRSARNLDDSYSQIDQLAMATGHGATGSGVIEEMRSGIQAAIDSVPASVKDAGLTYYHELTSDYYTTTDGTFIGQIYSEFGLRSIAEGDSGYPQLTSEAVVAADPDYVFLANTRAEGTTPETVAQRPGWDTITAVREDQVINLNDDIASRWGPRIVELVEQIAQALNSHAAVPAAA